ncbi:MAG: glycoside hydrolase family 127 protein [Oscillospiraceae bacterium]|nr:glycoside hydrolase family 127 protein [Oscillospiraceae bacterium]
MKEQRFLGIDKVKISDDFWSRLQDLVIGTVIPYQYEIMDDRIEGAEKSHALENFRIAAGESEGEFYGMVFQDSDVAKWLEAVAYSLAIRPDPELEAKADRVIETIGKAQQEDGYIDTYFIVKDPDHKWADLHEAHELYCMGHMIEAAVAFKEALGKDSLLNIMRKAADLICDRFGKGKVRGYPGHQEIEMALIRLYRVTGEKKYLDTALYFLDERGTKPDLFIEESKTRDIKIFQMDPYDLKYAQTHMPVREQDKAVGHAVRAGYMYTAMADMASETDDEGLLEACRRLWDNITTKQMYITGGVGATVHGESYSVDYELPNDIIYAETCASVAMAFFARRMLELEVKGEYADILEKELYNGIISGMQSDGKRFFYSNPLEVVPGVSGVLPEYAHIDAERPGWYRCACCPPNVARLLTSLGTYVWGESEDTVYAHLFVGGKADFSVAGGVTVTTETDYPWDGKTTFRISVGSPRDFRFAVHVPGWCWDWKVIVNGREEEEYDLIDGYVYLDRTWADGDTVELDLEMEPTRMYANPRVRADIGCVAFMRGPVVYCFEQADNGEDLMALRAYRDGKLSVHRQRLGGLGEYPILTVKGARLIDSGELYSDEPFDTEDVTLKAVPYYLWGNRGKGGMRVWIGEI